VVLSPNIRAALVGLVVLFLASRAADRSADLRTVFTWIGLLAAAGLAAYVVSDRAKRRYRAEHPERPRRRWFYVVRKRQHEPLPHERMPH
jgi:hypothetical protein